MKIILNHFLFIVTILPALQCGQSPTSQPETKPATELTPQQQAMLEMEKSWQPMFDISVDTTIFNHHRVGTYTSDKYDKAMIAVSIVPMESFEAEKAKFKARKAKENETEKFKGIVSLGGREVIVSKKRVKEEGLELAMHLYQIAGDDKQTILVACACKPEHESEMDKVFEAAAQSVRLKK